MTLRNEHPLPWDEAKAARKFALHLLQEAGVCGQLPTPINTLVQAANLSVNRTALHDRSLLEDWAARSRIFARGGVETIKRAVKKVLGLVDNQERMIFLSPELHPRQEPFVLLHEAGHHYMPWQREAYQIAEEDESTISFEIRDLFEAQANAFASEALFQGPLFSELARSRPFSLASALKLGKTFGASAYSTLRRYVLDDVCPSCLVVVEKLEGESGPSVSLEVRRGNCIPSFQKQFGILPTPVGSIAATWSLYPFIPSGKRFVAPSPGIIRDSKGRAHLCQAEGFDSSFKSFVLIQGHPGANSGFPLLESRLVENRSAR